MTLKNQIFWKNAICVFPLIFVFHHSLYSGNISVLLSQWTVYISFILEFVSVFVQRLIRYNKSNFVKIISILLSTLSVAMSEKMPNSTDEEKLSMEKTKDSQTQHRLMSNTINYNRKYKGCVASFNKTVNGDLSNLPQNGIVLCDEINVGGEAENSTFTADTFINGKNINEGGTNETSGNV